MSALNKRNSSRCHFAVTQMLLLLAICAYSSLVSVPRCALAIESLEESAVASDSREDFEEGFAADTLLAKDTILKKNPANIGNKLKDLWEQIPEYMVDGGEIKK
ncbi:uncharacterized protein LOC128856715 [Anastrepha ludens]|uniref:uncharacterized protein LOC128856715 n=1 Tax=Anastrepha ludens TaxID=28586 RepID=UPI0023AFE514|nr:uncharacterized protein LOC128856715 [Anastrepha ludens]